MSRTVAVAGAVAALALAATACSVVGLNGGTVSTEVKISPDSAWASHGDYLGPVLEQVRRRWAHVLRETKSRPKIGTSATVGFELSATGAIARIVSVDGDSELAGQKTCVAAIVAAAPFPPWTDAMKASLGESTQITFTFYFQ
ncbi:MAG: hypothetical protein ABIZ04_11725 [Opitutus sp.]